MKPLATIIILNWNGLKYLKPCLDSLLHQTYPNYKIILVDNGSRDGSIAFVKDYYPQVDLIELSHNLGFATGNNIGFKYARKKYDAKYYFAVNNDTIADEKFIEEMIVAAQPQNVGMVAAKMILQDHDHLLDSAGHYILPSGLVRSRGRMEHESKYNNPLNVFGPCGGAALYTREFFDSVGMFDDDFFAYYEDGDLSWRGILAGWICQYNPRAIIYHKLHGTSHKKHKFLFISERNRFFVMIKNLPREFIYKNFFLILKQEIILLKDEQRLSRVIINVLIRIIAIFFLLPSILKLIRKRSLIQKNVKITYQEIMHYTNI